MQQEAAHELCGGQCHGFEASAPVFAVVLPAEHDAAIVQGNKARVGFLRADPHRAEAHLASNPTIPAKWFESWLESNSNARHLSTMA